MGEVPRDFSLILYDFNEKKVFFFKKKISKILIECEDNFCEARIQRKKGLLSA